MIKLTYVNKKTPSYLDCSDTYILTQKNSYDCGNFVNLPRTGFKKTGDEFLEFIEFFRCLLLESTERYLVQNRHLFTNRSAVHVFSNCYLMSQTLSVKYDIFLLINPFVPNAPFLYPLKTSENGKAFWCFQEIEKGCTGNKWVSNTSISLFKKPHTTGTNARIQNNGKKTGKKQVLKCIKMINISTTSAERTLWLHE